MKHHELKIWPMYYDQVASGQKTFELRDNDRDFKVGDIVSLREWDPNKPKYYFETLDEALCNPLGEYADSEILTFRVGYMITVDDKRVVFSLLKIGE